MVVVLAIRSSRLKYRASVTLSGCCAPCVIGNLMALRVKLQLSDSSLPCPMYITGYSHWMSLSFLAHGSIMNKGKRV